MSIFQPKETLTSTEISSGLRMMSLEGMASMGYTSIITSGFLAAYALVLGANNFQIGVLAALPFIMQTLQIPAILLVEKLRRRKAISVVTWLIAQLLWFPVALIPVFFEVPGAGAVSFLLMLMAIRGIFGSITTCSYNSWIGDLVPRTILGHYFSRRLALSTVVASAFGLGAAFFVDYWHLQVPSENAALGYTWILLFGAVFLGMASPFFMSRIPEPLMQKPAGEQPSLWKMVIMPLYDPNFRQLMKFLLIWGFALNMAVPFFVIYMLQRLGMPLSAVIGLYVLGQVFNILFLRVWGSLADRFGNKTVLSLCASLYLIVILGWTFTTLPDQYFLTVPLLVILHIFAGIATAGVSLTVSTIGFKLAPREQSASYLVGASIATNVGAGLGPIFGGSFAHFFGERKLALDLTWVDPNGTANLGVINVAGLDFLFLISFIIGMFTLNMLSSLREQGAAHRDAVLGELRAQSSSVFPSMNSVPASGFLNMFPLSLLNRVPGMDVAIGVTVYQLANTARNITLAALQGGRTAVKFARTLQKGLSALLTLGTSEPEDEREFTSQAARGAFQAIAETPGQPDKMIGPAILSIVRTMKKANKNPYHALRSAAHGIIEEAGESGSDLAHITDLIIAAAKETARSLSLDEHEAALQSARGALESAEMLGAPAVSIIKDSLPDDVATELASLREKENKKSETGEQY